MRSRNVDDREAGAGVGVLPKLEAEIGTAIEVIGIVDGGSGLALGHGLGIDLEIENDAIVTGRPTETGTGPELSQGIGQGLDGIAVNHVLVTNTGIVIATETVIVIVAGTGIEKETAREIGIGIRTRTGIVEAGEIGASPRVDIPGIEAGAEVDDEAEAVRDMLLSPRVLQWNRTLRQRLRSKPH